ncbi:MAG: phage holin family protein [Alphaproteobacteria bacterium]|nr:phage holin family protein [Alphaproteobacteria bacterium]
MTMQMPDDRPSSSMKDLFSSLLRDLSDLVRQEIALARAETGEKVRHVSRGAVWLGIGGVLAFAGLLFVLLAITLALSGVMAPWAAALIVGVVAAGIGVMLLKAGQNRLSPRNLTPDRTVRTLRDDAILFKRQMGR